MPANMGNSSYRLARFAIGLALIARPIPVGFASTGWKWVGWSGVILFSTAAFEFRPLYTMPGISTCAARRVS